MMWLPLASERIQLGFTFLSALDFPSAIPALPNEAATSHISQ